MYCRGKQEKDGSTPHKRSREPKEGNKPNIARLARGRPQVNLRSASTYPPCTRSQLSGPAPEVPALTASHRMQPCASTRSAVSLPAFSRESDGEAAPRRAGHDPSSVSPPASSRCH